VEEHITTCFWIKCFGNRQHLIQVCSNCISEWEIQMNTEKNHSISYWLVSQLRNTRFFRRYPQTSKEEKSLHCLSYYHLVVPTKITTTHKSKWNLGKWNGLVLHLFWTFRNRFIWFLIVKIMNSGKQDLMSRILNMQMELQHS